MPEEPDRFAIWVEKLANELYGTKSRTGGLDEDAYEAYIEVARQMGCCRPTIVDSPRPCCIRLDAEDGRSDPVGEPATGA